MEIKIKDGLRGHDLPFFENLTLEQLVETKRVKERMEVHVTAKYDTKKTSDNLRTLIRTSIPQSKLFPEKEEKEEKKEKNTTSYEAIAIYEKETSPPVLTYLPIMTKWAFYQGFDTIRVTSHPTSSGLLASFLQGQTAVCIHFKEDEDYSDKARLFDETLKQRLRSNVIPKDNIEELKNLESSLRIPLFNASLSLLTKAAQAKATKTMEYLLTHPSCPKNYPNEPDDFGSFPLLECSTAPTIRLLLDHGADPLKTNRQGKNFLFELTRGHQLTLETLENVLAILPEETIQKLLLMQTSEGDTILHTLAGNMFENPSVINYLITRGADPTTKNKKGQAPIDVEMRNSSHADILATPYKRERLKNSDVQRLINALNFGQVEVVQEMIDQGLDVWEYDVSRGSAFGRVVDEDRGHTYLTTEKQREAAHLLLSQPDTPRDYLSWKGGFVVSEPLFTIKTPEGLQFLIDHGAKVSKISSFFSENLLHATFRPMSPDHLVMRVKLICKEAEKLGVNLNEFIAIGNKDQSSALETAKSRSNETQFADVIPLLEKYSTPGFSFAEEEEKEREEEEKKRREEEEKKREEEERKRRKEEENKREEEEQKRREEERKRRKEEDMEREIEEHMRRWEEEREREKEEVMRGEEEEKKRKEEEQKRREEEEKKRGEEEEKRREEEERRVKKEKEKLTLGEKVLVVGVCTALFLRFIGWI